MPSQGTYRISKMKKSYCKVIESGFYTSIQDCGRQGWRSKGVPLSGPMDRASFNRANRIVGNVPGLASLEITLSGPTLLFNDPVWVAASGAPLSLFHNDKEQRMGFPFLCDLGDILRIGKIEKGARAYLSFLGGLQCRKYLGSASQFAPITPNGRLEKGDQLSFVSSLSFPDPLLVKNQEEADSLEERKFLRVRPGIDWDKCPLKQQGELKKTQFVIGSNNRMGYRLEGSVSALDFQPLSGVIPPGTIQLNTAGGLTVAMADGQVTGGYLRVLSLDQQEMNFLAQQTTGTPFKLHFVE